MAVKMTTQILDVQVVTGMQIKTNFHKMIRIQIEPIMAVNKIVHIDQTIMHIQIMELNIHLINNLCVEMIDQDIIHLVIKLIILSKFSFSIKIITNNSIKFLYCNLGLDNLLVVMWVRLEVHKIIVINRITILPNE